MPSNTTSPTREPDSAAYRRHLARNRRVWDRWSDHYGLSESDFEPIREAAIDRLELEAGDRVLEVGCGPGVNFEPVSRAIGQNGQLVAVEYSPRMIEKANERVDRLGLESVDIVRADAGTVAFDAGFDAAIATLALSVMPDVRTVVETVHDALDDGSPFVIVDVRPVPRGPARIANPLIRRGLQWFANWNPDGDVPGTLASTFAECEVVDTAMLGTAYTALCRKRGDVTE